MNILSKIDKYKYISFDIFDTLVSRNVLVPEDVFDIVEAKYNNENKILISNFRENRKKAQIDAAKKNNDKEETVISEIYSELVNYYDKKICDKLYKIELETELNVCVPNQKYVDYYNYCINNNKEVIITSDMYLDKKTIESILKKCGVFKYKKLYLSSFYQKRKSTGTIFDYIIDDLQISKNDIIHIGDNKISDYIIPRLKGISSILVKNKDNNMFYNNNIDAKYVNQYKMLEKFISNNIDISNSYYYKMGYETFGPILYGFSNWLKDNIKTKKIFFLSRDGYLISKAFNIVTSNVSSSYFYASRRALIIPTLFMDKDLKSMLNKIYIRDYIKIGNLFRKLGLEKDDYEKQVQKYGFRIDEEIKYEELFKNKKFQKLFNELKPVIYENSKKEYDLLLAYMKQEKFNGDVSIVDIGWNGNMQMAFNNVINKSKVKTKIEGYYIGVLPESKNIGKIKMNGYLFDEIKNRDIYICLKVINSIFESMFLAPHGSVKKYKKNNSKIEPVLLDYEYDEGIEMSSYKEIQEGALQFVRDFTSSDLKEILKIDSRLSFYNMKKFAYKPSTNDVKKFGDFKFLEDDIIYLAKPKRLRYYFTHPKELFTDIYLSGWLIGFMKRLTKFNIFYTQLYKFYINIYLKKRNQKLGDS